MSDEIRSEFHESYEDDFKARVDSTEVNTVAYDIASWVMEEFRPGFVIIGSPNIGITDSGIPYPDSIGVVLNNEVSITKSSLVETLTVLISHLNSDIDKIQSFLSEALDE